MFRKASKDDVKDLQKLLVSAFAVTYENLYLTLKTNGIPSKDWSGYYILEIEGDLIGCIVGGYTRRGPRSNLCALPQTQS